MTPQAFSYPVVANNSFIYVAPYGLTESLDYILKVNPKTYSVSKIKINVSDCFEKWQNGIVYQNYIIWLPYNESCILILDTTTDTVQYINLEFAAKGKFVQGHIYNDNLYALPYGEDKDFDWTIKLNLKTFEVISKRLFLTVEDAKRFHTTQISGDKIHGLPRGENPDPPTYNYRIEYNLSNGLHRLIYEGWRWIDLNEKYYSNKKFTTMAKVGNKLYAPPYSELPEFDYLGIYNGKSWNFQRTGITSTSRKYFTHIVASNGKVFFPPAGHDENWSEMLVINSLTDDWHTIDLGLGKESKKYFAGVENSQGKLFFIPRGGCVCEPEESWKSQGDLAEVLVVDSHTENFYTIDVGEYFKDNTTIEKYNKAVIVDDIIFAFPYGESDSFQTVLIFDSVNEKVINTIDLNDI